MGALEAFGRSNVSQNLGIALQELRSRRAEELEQKRLGLSERYVNVAEGADTRAADLAAIQNPAIKAQAETSALKSKIEKTTIEETEARLNQKTDPTLHPMFVAMVPEQQKFAMEMMKRGNILDKDGLATNRQLKNLVDMVETDSKRFAQFSDIGVQSMKNNITGLYQEIAKATESGNQKKVEELTAKVTKLQEQYSKMINFIPAYIKNLKAWEKLTPDVKNALSQMGVGPGTYDVEKEDAYKIAIKKYFEFISLGKSGELTTTKKNYNEYRAQHPEYKGDILDFKKMWDGKKTTGELTEGSVINQFDNFALDKGTPELKGQMYDEYLALIDKGMTREKAFNKVLLNHGGNKVPTPSPINTKLKLGSESSLWSTK